MSVAIKPVTENFVGEVSGVDLSVPLADTDVTAIDGRHGSLRRLDLP